MLLVITTIKFMKVDFITRFDGVSFSRSIIVVIDYLLHFINPKRVPTYHFDHK